MGANTVRSLTLGVSTGHRLSVWPSKGETNDDAFESIDYAIGTARHYGIRCVKSTSYQMMFREIQKRSIGDIRLINGIPSQAHHTSD